MNGELRVFQKEDVKALISCVSNYDREVMLQWINRSDVVIEGVFDDKALCIYGLISASVLSDEAYIWFWSTEHAASHPLIVARHSKHVVEHLLSMFPTITGHCVTGHERSIRWLSWLGAIFGEPQGLLVPFTIKAK